MIEIAAFICFAALVLVWAFAPNVQQITPQVVTEPVETAPAAREALA